MIFVAFLICALVIICLAVIFNCRWRLRKSHDVMDDLFDRILARDMRLRTEITGENRISKLTHKANRIIDMYVTEAVQTRSEKEKIQGFISDMAHQMKTPLSGITMYADLLIEGNMNPAEQAEIYTRIKSNTKNLHWMMESLIKMSRLEVGVIELSPTPQSIKETLAGAIENVLAAASAKNTDILVTDFSDINLRHDRRWTQEAFTNILENAVKYANPESEIRLTVEPLPLHTKVIVTNRGMGINKNEWHLIFKRFYRGKNAKDTPGAGLGLYLAALLMEKQGGYIMVDSTPGEFTAFSLYFQQ